MVNNEKLSLFRNTRPNSIGLSDVPELYIGKRIPSKVLKILKVSSNYRKRVIASKG